MLRLMATFCGSARVLGHDMADLRPRRAAALRARSLGIVDQHYHRSLPPELRCQGLGRRLVQALLDKAAATGLATTFLRGVLTAQNSRFAS